MAIYLKLDGVDGNATHHVYQNWITLQNFHWGMDVDVSTTVGDATNRMGAGKITPSDVTAHKEFDKASVPLLKLAFAGLPKESCEIVVTQQASDVGEAYLRYKLFKVFISSFVVGASDNGSPQDTFTINFEKMEVTATTVDDSNNPSPLRGGYDFKSGKQL